VVEGLEGGVVVDLDAVDLAADQAAGAVAVGAEVLEVGAAGNGPGDAGGAELPAMLGGARAGRGGIGEEGEVSTARSGASRRRVADIMRSPSWPVQLDPYVRSGNHPVGVMSGLRWADIMLAVERRTKG
jgi:hypothetical protein